MKEAEFEGRSVEEALLKASHELGVNISDMAYEVLEVESGVFGIFGKSVRIRVRVPEDASKLSFRKEYIPGPGDTGLAAGMDAVDQEGLRPAPAPGHDDESDSAAAGGEPTESKGPWAREVLETLLGYLDISAEITVTEDDEQILINVGAVESGDVIGKDGELLSSLQFLLNKIVNRFPEGRKRIILDSAGFRDRREVDLGDLARSLGEKALSTGKVVRLSPMNAQDRRLVHMALKDHPGLKTHSEGEGHYRSLLIVPNSLTEREDSRNRGGQEGGSGERGPRPGSGR
jgi:spoIIIJ-associated protein